MPQTFLHGQLLQRRELLWPDRRAGHPVEIHGAHLARDRLDPRVVRGDVQDRTTAEARTPHPQPIGVDLWLQRQPRQGAAVVLDLVPGKDPLARLAPLAPKER
jgi:hypothetical protein